MRSNLTRVLAGDMSQVSSRCQRCRWYSTVNIEHYRFAYYNDNLMVLIESLAAIGYGTRGFQKAQMGSNET